MRRGERGAFLLIMTICLVVLCTLVAFAVDLGQGRFSKRDSQQSADLASLAAGFYLSGKGSGSSVQSQPRAACEAAFNSLLTNTSSFTPTATATSACSAFPATDAGCTSATATLTASDTDPRPGVQGGPYDMFIEWPVPDAVIADPSFSGGAGIEDGDACDRMRIRVDKQDSTTFGRVIGVDAIDTSVDAVVKGAPGLPSTGVAALLLLEREGCGTLRTSGQGIVRVRSVGTQPGVIQSDTAGSTSFTSPKQCSNQSNNANGMGIYGESAPASLGGGPSIIAENSPDGTLGIIATYAATVGGRAACCYPSGLSVDGTGSDFTSRTPADDRFNPTTRPAIADLHADNFVATITNGPALVDTVITDCSPSAATTTHAQTGTITVNCPAGFNVANNKTVIFENASTVKFIGGINVAGGGTLEVRAATTVTLARSAASLTGNTEARLVVGGIASFNQVRNFYVGGTQTNCTTNSNCSSIKVSGSLRVNTGSVNTTTCAPGIGSGGSAANWTRLATLGGHVDVSGSVTLCQTMAYVGRSEASYAPRQRTTGGLNCDEPNRPCPVLSDSATRDRFDLSGGSGTTIVWTAPNQTTTPPNDANPFEGLSLWVEGSGPSLIKGQGTLDTTGVYFLPNADFDFNGRASAANPFNAQFFSRTLLFSGQGVLNLLPDPRDAVPTPIPGTYSIIR